MQLSDEIRDDLTVRNVLASVYDRTAALKSGEVAKLLAGQAALAANLARLAGKDFVDEQQVADLVLAGLAGRADGDVAAALVAALGEDRARAVGAILAGSDGPAD